MPKFVEVRTEEWQAAVRDARRYQWLVEHAKSVVTGPFNWHWQDEHRPHPPMRTLDQCIDEAIAKATT